MKKRLSVAATFIGAFIGAGFASGREIALYFGDTSIAVPLASGALIGLFLYLFLRIGSFTHGNPLLLWGRARIIADAVIFLSNFVTLCAMVSAADEVIFSLFGFHGGGIIAGLFALATVIFGVEKLKLSNLFIVPIIVVLIAILTFKTASAPPAGRVVLLPAFSYCTMNIVGGGFLAAGLAEDFTERDCAVTALIGGIAATLIIIAVFLTIQNTKNSDMPLIGAAALCGMETVGSITLLLAVFTTMTGCLSVSSRNNPIAATIIVSVSLVAATVGFRTLVDKLYPVLGGLGGIVATAFAAIYVFRLKKEAR